VAQAVLDHFAAQPGPATPAPEVPATFDTPTPPEEAGAEAEEDALESAFAAVDEDERSGAD
jgi:hypothetical protein